MKPTMFDAIYTLVGGTLSSDSDDPKDFLYESGQTAPTEGEIQVKLKELEKEYADNEFQRKRLEEYNAIGLGEQLDMIYWDKKNGTKKWEEAIDKVKGDNPKPE
tara:strand:- start:15346 stop:15657 length:312 start_codon:yes stop_codon:yes gene_type:complete